MSCCLSSLPWLRIRIEERESYHRNGDYAYQKRDYVALIHSAGLKSSGISFFYCIGSLTLGRLRSHKRTILYGIVLR